MKLVVCSDSHGNLDVLEKILADNPEEDTVLIHLGDGEREVEYLRWLNSDKKILFVAGNCDFESSAPNYATAKFCGYEVFYTHGADFGVKGGLSMLKSKAAKHSAKIVLYGHTHCAFIGEEDGMMIMNPGSCSRPRMGKPSYGIIDFSGDTPQMKIVEI